MDNEQKQRNDVYSLRVKAGKRRTYFFDIRATKGNDYYLTITESKKKTDSDQYERHKIFIYKEDFAKFIQALENAVEHVKTELMPDFDFDAYQHHDDDADYTSTSEDKNSVSTTSSTERRYTVDDDEGWD